MGPLLSSFSLASPRLLPVDGSAGQSPKMSWRALSVNGGGSINGVEPVELHGFRPKSYEHHGTDEMANLFKGVDEGAFATIPSIVALLRARPLSSHEKMDSVAAESLKEVQSVKTRKYGFVQNWPQRLDDILEGKWVSSGNDRRYSPWNSAPLVAVNRPKALAKVVGPQFLLPQAQAQAQAPAQAPESDGELVFYSYDDDGDNKAKGGTLKSKNGVLSSTVASAIGREMKRGKKKKRGLHAARPPNMPQIKFSSMPSMAQSKTEFSTKKMAPSKLSTTSIEVLSAKIGHSLDERPDIPFDVRPLYSYQEIFSSESTGSVILKKYLNETQGILPVAVLERRHLVTNVDITLGPGELQYQVPMLEQDSLIKFLGKHELEGRGGFVLIELDDETESVDLEGPYEAKFYLGSDLKVLSEERDYRYVFFVGVSGGNKLLGFKSSGQKISSKIIHVTDDEVFFEINGFVSGNTRIFELYEDNVFGRVQRGLDVNPSEISLFNGPGRMKRRGLYRYELIDWHLPLGSRRYLRFNHLDGESIFVGFWDAEHLDLPGMAYIQQIQRDYGISDLESMCLVQINLSRPVKNMEIDGKSPFGLNLSVMYLEKDGIFYEEITDRSDKVFILGDAEGVIGGQVEYLNGTVDYFQSYCSENTYLVEQF